MPEWNRMNSAFDADRFPGKPKILFVGLAESTHTLAWIDLLAGAELNIRLFALPTGVPPQEWGVRTYVSAQTSANLDPGTRRWLHTANRTQSVAKRAFTQLRFGGRADGSAPTLFSKEGLRHLLLGSDTQLEEWWLAQVIRRWQPDVIHTLGLDSAAYFYLRTRRTFKLAGIGRWVLQLRGGSDLTLSRLDPTLIPRISEVLRECDQLLSDNEENFRFASELGLQVEQISPLRVVPGTGGVDVDRLAQLRQIRPSSSRIVLWPKAYESMWSKATPVLEAIRLAWEQIQPCEIYMLAMYPQSEAWLWYRTLPEQIQRCCYPNVRIPRGEVLELMAKARVLLAPSLIDGTPNSLFEAMAAGILPIVSPLETIRPIVQHETNVLFARNLYPDEIAQALVRAMMDDALVDRAAERNLADVRRLADRATIGPRVVAFYEQVAKV